MWDLSLLASQISPLTWDRDKHATQSCRPHLPHFLCSLISLWLPLCQGPRTLGVQIEKQSERARTSSVTLSGTSLQKRWYPRATPHGTGARGRLLLARFTERDGEPTGTVRGCCLGSVTWEKCTCDYREKEEEYFESIHLASTTFWWMDTPWHRGWKYTPQLRRDFSD